MMNSKQIPKTRGDDKQPLGEQTKAVLRQTLMVLLGNLGVLGAGMAVAIPSVTLGQLTNRNEKFFLTNAEASWYAAISSIACPFGGLLVGFLLDRLGRTNTMLLTNIIGVVGWALLATAPWQVNRESVYAQILLGRFLSGLMIGLCVTPVAVYAAEISLPTIRGRLVLGTSIGIAGGTLSMYLLGYFVRNDWQLIATIACLVQMAATICVLPMPDSPSWLMQKGRSEEARKALEFFRGLNRNDSTTHDEFESELSQIQKTSELNGSDGNRPAEQNQSIIHSVRQPEVFKPLLIMISFFGIQQLAGCTVVVIFAVQISISAGVSIDPVFCAVLVGLSRIVTICFTGSIFEKWGRRPAGLVSAAGLTVCMYTLALGIQFPIINAQLPLLPAVCIVLHITFSTMGLLTLPFFMNAEVYPQKIRGAASGTTIFFGLLMAFVVVKIYPNMDAMLGAANLFAFYGSISLMGIAFVYFFVPETRQRTLLEIENYFRTGNFNATKTGQMHAAVANKKFLA